MGRQVAQEDLIAMVKDGLSDKDIGERIGLSKESTARLRVRRGIMRKPDQRARNKVPPEVLTECEKMLSEGYSFSAVEEMLGVSRRALRRNFPGGGFTKEQSAELTSMRRKLEKIR